MPPTSPQDNIAVVLVRTKSSGNIGAVARSMMNMGFSHLYLVDPVAHHLNRESMERAKDAGPIIKKIKIFHTLEEATQEFHHIIGTSRKLRHVSIPSQTPHELAQYLPEYKNKKIALVFGPEDRGLTNEDLKHCEFIIKIPSAPKFPSLNLSHAVMVVLYEIFIALQDGDTIETDQHINQATSSDKEALFDHFKQALLHIDFLDPLNPDRIMRDMQNILNRAELDKREVSILRGMCRQILNK